MKEFDSQKDACIMGHDGKQYFLQDGRKYLIKKGQIPQVLLHIGGKKTNGGGKAFVCQCCNREFSHPVYLGRHYQESIPCREYRRRVKRDKMRTTRQHTPLMSQCPERHLI